MAEIPALYLIPQEQMDEIMARLKRIEENTRQKPEPVEQIGKVYSADVVADKLNVTKPTVYQWAREGRIRCVRAGGRVLFPESALQSFLQEGMS